LPAAAPGELPIPRSLPAARPFHAVGSLDSMSRLKPIGPKVVAPGAGTAQPSAEEVLSDLPASTASNAQPEEKFGWAGGSQRNLVSAREPHFPAILGASGVEVECTAQITVSPAGNVTRVEITKGSGYTEVDASVEAALREFLFSQVDGSRDAVGTVTFRFRLEKQD